MAFTPVIPDVSFLGHEWQELGREQPAAPEGQLCAVVATAIGYMARFSQRCFIRGETSLHSVPQIPCTPRQ